MHKTFQIIKAFFQKIFLVIFGVVLGLLLLEAGLRLAGLIILSWQEATNRLSLRQKGAYRILCVGESTTQGQYPAFLEAELNRRNIGIKFSVIDKGVSGIRTSGIVDKIEKYLDEYRPDMVISMMGINDGGMQLPYDPAQAGSDQCDLKLCKLIKIIFLHAQAKFSSGQNYALLRQRAILNKQLAALKIAIEAEPGNRDLYLKMGQLYSRYGLYQEAKILYEKAFKLNPGNYTVCLQLALIYRCLGDFSQAEVFLKKAVKIDGNNPDAYVLLAGIYRGNMRGLAEKMCQKAIELDQRNARAYIELGRIYKDSDKANAEKAFKKAIELDPQYSFYYILGAFYRGIGKLPEAEEAFRKALRPGKDKTWGALQEIYEEKGDLESSLKYKESAEKARLEYFRLSTYQNYHKLRSILARRKVAYACMQYPMRKIADLKKIFQEDDQGIIFIDNEGIFKKAVGEKGYTFYFRDSFGGEFGHCTKKGNKLLAGHIADILIKEVFGN